MNLWGVELPDRATSAVEHDYLAEVARRHPAPITLAQLWALNDQAWDASGASTDKLDAPEARAFYRHPVWLLNGIFAEVDPESRGHREALARWVEGTGERDIVDFGGGYGALARRIVARMPEARVRIVDPYPSAVSVALCAPTPQIRYVSGIEPSGGVVIAQDVLEHVADPVGLTRHLVEHTRPGGWLVFANCFQPCIKCHVPSTFHLERTFSRLMALLGCRARGSVPGCEHALAFERTGSPAAPWRLAVFATLSRMQHAIRRGRTP